MKISFFLINMNLGGTEKAFLNFADELLKLGCELELVLFERNGDLLNDLPKGINVIILDYYKIKTIFENSPKYNITHFLKKRKFKSLFLFFLNRIVLFKYLKNKFPFYEGLSNEMMPQNYRTDVAIAYAGPHELISYIISEKTNSKRKFQWIHFDINKINFDHNFYLKILKSYDKIFAVSNFVKEQLISRNSKFLEKTELFYNVLPIEKIIGLSEVGEDYRDNFVGLRILSIGRATYEKGFDIVIDIAKRLKEKNIHFKWYLIGEGTQKNALIQKTKLLNLENEIIFLGMKSNPYTYLKNCHIYLQPSRQEGFGITVSEAKIFNKPIVVTNIPGFREQIIHKKSGYISEGFDSESLLKGIEYFLNLENINFVKSNLETFKHENNFGVEEFLKLLN